MYMSGIIQNKNKYEVNIIWFSMFHPVGKHLPDFSQQVYFQFQDTRYRDFFEFSRKREVFPPGHVVVTIWLKSFESSEHAAVDKPLRCHCGGYIRYSSI